MTSKSTSISPTARRIAGLLCLIGWLALVPSAHAQVVGTVTNLSGILAARNAQGVTRLLAVDSPVHQGDTLTTESRAYAQLKFADGAELTLQPQSMLVVTRYSYDAGKPQDDKVELGLAQGGFRSIAGALGQRSRDATVINTPAGVLKGSASMVVSLVPQ
ncbi:hypothetical protein EJP69_20825 [Variovorax gossypii]|uniref:FecR protein domain-containing protein n=1 Tax=Variovorax gossypii TaxID=1679495 RepID=A0A3S0GTH3_9BURK|nr:FecR domain-containing protein [Variovorax gossypii]RTQ32397.1 hypothetical protein EJP69_20825 [Variovorax gossypii]